MIEKYLMSYGDYTKLGNHPNPYKFTVEKGGQFLYYFGANHSRDPKNEQYNLIRKFWNEFLEKIDKANSIVFVEGGKRSVCYSEVEAITKGAEGHFITYLATKEGIGTFSPEPPDKFKFERLLKQFSKEEIVFYQFARLVYQWNRYLDEKPDFERYVGNSLKHDQKSSRWFDFDFSIDHMIRIQKNMFGMEFNKEDQNFYYEVISPTENLSRINELARFEGTEIRESYILGQIEKYWDEGKSLFIMYGCSHAVMHEPAIRKLDC